MSFRRPTGAPADVRELEYVAALHQTCLPSCRENGTVSSWDVLRFLKSRLGVETSHADCLRIVRGLGGGRGVVGDNVLEKILVQSKAGGNLNTISRSPEEALQKRQAKVSFQRRLLRAKKKQQQQEREDVEAQNEDEDNNNNSDSQQQPQEDEEPEEYLDLVQLVAVLLIPTLARVGKEWRESRAAQAQQQQQEDDDDNNNNKNENNMQTTAATTTTTNDGGWLGRLEAWDEARRADCERDICESLRPPSPDRFITDALATLLRSVVTANTTTTIPGPENDCAAGAAPPPPAVVLTPLLVRQLLEAHGEYERAADDKLLQEMVEAAVSSSSSGVLDEEALVRALTLDVTAYPVESEDRLTSGFYDVFGFESFKEHKEIIMMKEKEEEEAQQHDKQEDGALVDQEHLQAEASFRSAAIDAENTEPYELSLGKILSPIDFAVDAHSSTVLMVLIWAFFFLTMLLYAVLFESIEGLGGDPACDKTKLGCRLGDTVVSWVVFACIFIAVGFVMVIPLSVGNNPRRRSKATTLFSLVMSGLYTFLPFVAVENFKKNAEKPYNAAENAVHEPFFDQGMWLVIVVGMVVMALFVCQFVLSLLGNRRIRDSKFLNRWFASSAIRGFARTKKAATRKVNAMLRNAHRLHSLSSSSDSENNVQSRSAHSRSGTSASEEIMINYLLRGESYEKCGGLLWTWKRVFSGALFDGEGVWIFSRLIVFQFLQFALGVFLAYAAFFIVEVIADEADKATAQLEEDWPRDGDVKLPDWVYDIVPNGNEVRGALYPAAGVALFVMVTIFSIYLPSYVKTTLMYRCGMIPSLNSPYFTKFRTNVDLVYGNIGNALYAMVGATFLFWALTALVLFLFIWDFSRDFMILITAWGIGLVVTIVLKMILVKACRKRFYAGFYRTRPRAANLSTLALECWFIGLGGGVLVGRFIQFILAACFWVGRTDAPFLSSDVNLGGYAFDYVPMNFRKDLLVHEAHHHPYLERILTMYLMKLKTDSFCSDAGACWRQLFVVSFMPWLMKYRVFSDKRLTDAMEAYDKNSNGLALEEEKPSKDAVTEEAAT